MSTHKKMFRIVWRSCDSGCEAPIPTQAPIRLRDPLFVFPAEASRVCALLQDLLEMENEMEEFGMDMLEDEAARGELYEGLTLNSASHPHLCRHEEGGREGVHSAEADHLIDIDLTHLNLSPQAAELLALTVIELLAHQNVSVFDIEGGSLSPKRRGERDAHRRLASSARCRLDHNLIEQIIQKSSFGAHIESKTASFKDAEESSSLTIQPPTTASLTPPSSNTPPSSPSRIHLIVCLLCAAVGLDFIGCSAGSSIIGDYVVEALCTMSPREMEEAMGGSYSRIDTEAVDVIHSSILANVLLLQQQHEREDL